MNCQKASSLLSAYLDRELSPEERRQLRLHLMGCSECTEEMRELEELKATLSYLSVPAIPSVIPWLRAQLAANAPAEAPVLAWQQPWFRRTCAVAALLLLFGLSSWLLLPQRRASPNYSNPLPLLPDTSWVSVDRIGP
ncbi:MAG: anti-sigma factor family protein [Bacteroidota bacterium]